MGCILCRTRSTRPRLLPGPRRDRKGQIQTRRSGLQRMSVSIILLVSPSNRAAVGHKNVFMPLGFWMFSSVEAHVENSGRVWPKTDPPFIPFVSRGRKEASHWLYLEETPLWRNLSSNAASEGRRPWIETQLLSPRSPRKLSDEDRLWMSPKSWFCFPGYCCLKGQRSKVQNELPHSTGTRRQESRLCTAFWVEGKRPSTFTQQVFKHLLFIS